MSKSRNIADLGSNDVLETDANGVTVTGGVASDTLNVDSGTLFVDGTNNRVGIGTSSPETTLDVNGQIKSTGNPANLILQSTGATVNASRTDVLAFNNSFTIQSRDSSGNFISNDYIIQKGDNGAIKHQWNIGSSEAMRIDSSGNVGIGTSSPSHPLDINGNNDAVNARIGGTLQVWNDATPTRAHGYLSLNNTQTMVGGNMRVDDRVTSGSHIGYSKGTDLRGGAGIKFDNSNELNDYGSITFLQNNDTDDDTWDVREAMLIDSSGNVGIGTSSPAEKLHVDGSGEHIVVTPVDYNSNQDSAYLVVSASNEYGSGDGNWADVGFQHRLKVNSVGVPRLTIDTPNSGELFSVVDNGNVGIGKTSPSEKLEVNGNIIADGVYLGGTGSANYLDDYEEGTWTPEFKPQTGSFNSISYSNQLGFYTKTGNAVHVTALINISSIDTGSSSGTLRISNLPFVNGELQAAGSATLQRQWLQIPEGVYVDSEDDFIYLTYDEQTTYQFVSVSDINTGGDNRIYINVIYQTHS